MSVEGIGFKPYVAVCNALNIPWVLRTDNDIFAKPTNAPTIDYFAGVSRIMGILEQINRNDDLVKYWNAHSANNEWKHKGKIPDEARALNAYIAENASKAGLFLSDNDLENDLANSPLRESLFKHYNKGDLPSLIASMKTKKAENMFDFLAQNHENLKVLSGDIVAAPLVALKQIVVERTHPTS